MLLTKKICKWSFPAEEYLCQLWQKHQVALRGTRKKNHIFKQMSINMQKKNFLYSTEEIHCKYNSLISKYRREKAKMLQSGLPTEWSLYHIVRDLVGETKTSKTEFLKEDSMYKDDSCYISSCDETNADADIAEEMQWDALERLSSKSCADRPNSGELKTLETEEVSIPWKPDPETTSHEEDSFHYKYYPGTPTYESYTTIEQRDPETTTPAAEISTKKISKTCIEMKVLKELKKANSLMKLQMEEERENTNNTEDFQRKIVAIEEKRNELLETLILDSRSFQNALLSALTSKINI